MKRAAWLKPAPGRGRWPMWLGAIVLALVLASALAASWITPVDPLALQPSARNLPPGATVVSRNDDGEKISRVAPLGTDPLGRDLLARVLHGARLSLLIGLAVAALTTVAGLAIGLAAGTARMLDAVLMRVMDGLMSIPPVLLAIALVSLSGATLATVIGAIVLPEIPRMARLVRSVATTVRREPYVEAAITLGTTTPRIVWRHVLPGTLGPVIVQATYVAASAILVEAILGFLGVGLPLETPTWGNILAEGRRVFQSHPHVIAFPALMLSLTVLAVHLLGDGLRERFDPRTARGER